MMFTLPAGWRPHSQAFRATFLGDDGRPTPASAIVLGRLAKFCHANRTTLKVSFARQQADPIATAAAEGRREVWLLLQQYLTLDESDVMRVMAAHDRAQESNDNTPF